MKKIVSKILILTLVLAGTTRCFAQLDSERLCLTFPEFDFYANALVERNALAIDTTVLSLQIRVMEKENLQLNRQLDLMDEKVANKNSEISDLKTAFTDLSNSHEKQGKRLVIFKKAALVLSVSTLIFGTLLFLK